LNENISPKFQYKNIRAHSFIHSYLAGIKMG